MQVNRKILILVFIAVFYLSSGFTAYDSINSLGPSRDEQAIDKLGKIQADTNPPALHNISFAGPTVTPTIPVKIVANITDDLSGVSMAYVDIYNPAGVTTGNTWWLNYNDTTGFYEGDFTPNQWWLLGDYYIHCVSAVDNGGTWGEYYNGTDFTAPTVQVTGTTPDTEVPALHSVVFTASSVDPSSTAGIVANITDDLSEVSKAYVNIYDPTGVTTGVSWWLDYNSTSGFWEGEFTPNGWWLLGDYYIHCVSAVDHSGKWGEYYNGTDFITPIVQVIGTMPDTEAPDLHSIVFTASTVELSDTVGIVANITDNFSGMSMAYVDIYNPAGVTTGESWWLYYNSYTGFWEGEFTPNEWWLLGDYYIHCVSAEDNSGKWGEYYNGTDIATVLVEVVDNATDTDQPMLHSIYFQGTTVTPSSSIKIAAYLTDDYSGVLMVYVNIYDPAGMTTGVSWWLDYNSTSGLWEGEFTPNQWWLLGDYYIYCVSIEDNSGKWGEYYNGTDFATPFIQVTGTTPDTEVPLFHSITFGSSTVARGSSVRIIANITDNLSGVSMAYVIINFPNSTNTGVSWWLDFNSTSGLWEGEFTPELDFPLGTYYLYSVSAEDNGGKWGEYYSNTDFTTPEVELVELSSSTSSETTTTSSFSSSSSPSFNIPGFELVLLVTGLLGAIIIRRRRK